ncbi:MAG: endolytic transglycosylase MltG [Actinomycetes bacterium]
MALSTGSKVFLVVLLVVFGAIGGGLWYVNDQLAGVPGEGEVVTVDVAMGTSVNDLAVELEGLGVVKSALAFRLVARNEGLASDLKAGSYELRTGMSVDEAIEALRIAPTGPAEVQFTVQEGLSLPLTLEQLDREFDAYDVDDFQAVLDARMRAGGNAEGVLRLPEWLPEPATIPDAIFGFEGVLFPNTYRVLADASPQTVLQRMVDQLERTMEALPADAVAAAEERGLSRYDLMIVASLIERETRVDAERARVAGVIYNRLERGMLLQIDATVLYAKGEWSARVLTSDTEIDSPYNTYNEGVVLPPTPISGFGEASLRAAVQPEETDFLYYVVAPECDGSHRFATTLDEHNANVADFRAAGRCAADG